MSPAPTTPCPDSIREADDTLRGTAESFLVIRGQCHRIVRVANRPQELIAALTIVEREVMRLTACVERARRLLTEDNPVGDGERAVDPHVVVCDAVDRFGGAAAERGIVLQVRDAVDGFAPEMDGEALRRAVDRLVASALIETPGGECLTVSVTTERAEDLREPPSRHSNLMVDAA